MSRSLLSLELLLLINFGPSLDTIRSATTVLSAHTKFKAATPSPSNRYQSGLAFLFCIYSLGHNTPCFLFCLSNTILCYYSLGIWNLWGSDVPTFGISFNGMPTTQRVLDPNVLQRRADRLGYLVVVAYQSGLVTIRMIINKYDRSRGGTLNISPKSKRGGYQHSPRHPFSQQRPVLSHHPCSILLTLELLGKRLGKGSQL